MSTLVLRSAVNRALTSTEIDANFTALNTDKVETTAPVFSGTVTLPSQSIDLTESNLPDVAPSLNLDFANSKQLDSRITFGRGSGGAYYDGKTTAKAEENLLLNSVLSSATSWAGSSATMTFNYGAIAAPDGSFTATRCQPVLGNTVIEQVANGFNVGGTKSIWARTITGTADACLMNYQGGDARIFPITTTWQRFTVTTINSIAYALFTLFDARIASHTATDFLVWAPQAENRSAVTAYTPTTSSPITNYIPVLLQAPLNTPRFDHDSRPTFNGTCTVSGSAVTLPTTFADGSSPSTINKFYTGSITISGTAYVITNYVGSTRVVTVTGSPTAGAFSLANKNYGQSLGLLIEEARANLARYSEDFGSAEWGRAGITMGTVGVAPNGNVVAQKLILTSGTIKYHAITSNPITVSANTTHTFSFYIKAIESYILQMEYRDSSATARAIVLVDLNAKTIVKNYEGGGAILTNLTLTPVGNGWYRASGTGNLGGTYTSARLVCTIYDATGSSYCIGNDYDGMFVWGAQLETGSFATSYIPTPSSATVTRQPDVAYMAGTNFSSWYNQSEGCLYAKYSINTAISNNTIASLCTYPSAANNNITIDAASTSRLFSYNQNTLLFVDNATGINSSAFSYGYTNTLFTSNAGTPYSHTNMNFPSGLNRLTIGVRQDMFVYGSMYIKKLTYYPKALSAPQLQGLTK